jgi:hypothetical protein
MEPRRVLRKDRERPEQVGDLGIPRIPVDSDYYHVTPSLLLRADSVIDP